MPADEIDEILSMAGPSGPEAVEEDPEASDIALDSIVGTMFDAIDTKDREGFKRALRDAFEMFAAEVAVPDFDV